MKAVVTGGAGFIGSHIHEKLIELKHDVLVLDNLSTGKKENIHPKAWFVNCDMCDREGIQRVFDIFMPDVVFHLAAQNEVPYSMTHPYEDANTNIIGMMNLLEAAKRYKSKIIYSNTGGASYGDVPADSFPILEDEPVIKPTSFYGVSKSCAELYLKLYGNLYDIPWVSFRYPNVYGPRQDGNREVGIVAMFTQKLLDDEIPTINGDGLHSRDYIYVSDVVDANIAAMTYGQNDYFNIATGVPTTNNKVFKVLKDKLKTKIKPVYGPDRPGDARYNYLSPAKAEKSLHWKAKVSFEQGIDLTINYYLQRR